MADYVLTANDAVIRRQDGARIPDDQSNRDWVAFQDWLAAGGVPDPYIPPVIKISTITPRQARLALLQSNLLETVEDRINQIGGETKITWEYATEINRDAPMIINIGESLNLTEQQIDDLFTLASTL